MVKIRLSRIGKKNRPYWRIVAVDSRKKRDGAYLENLGTYDPIRHEIVRLNSERVQHWVSVGAQCTPSVLKIVKAARVSA
jgi:small subunit ribosomal protein S16